jgi:carboxyvinyl-carboxyphosphonate phosphorylmutase
LESAGVSALTIEDTVLPRPFGSGGAQLISLEEGVGKMKAALAGRQDPSLVVAGRTSAAQVVGVDEAIRRTNAYAEVGVDAMFLAGVNSRADLEAIHAATDIPLIAGGSGELADRDYLAANGVRVALQGHLSFQAMVKAVYDTLKALRDGVAPADLRPTLASPDLMNQVTRQDDYNRWRDEFLR